MSYDRNLWNAVRNELKRDKTREGEMALKEIKCRNNQSLKFTDFEVGNAGPSGFCLIICLHGGGQCAASMNDSQWRDIIPFEKGGFKSGTIAVAPRGITNSWNLHFVDESFPAITRLIENYIIFKNIDPNKVYLMGFSAGGDGTYSLSERIPYLFAACSPQAGHPNGVSTINLCNLPTYLAAGEKDTSFQRNEICVEYYRKILAQNGKYYGNYIVYNFFFKIIFFIIFIIIFCIFCFIYIFFFIYIMLIFIYFFYIFYIINLFFIIFNFIFFYVILIIFFFFFLQGHFSYHLIS